MLGLDDTRMKSASQTMRETDLLRMRERRLKNFHIPHLLWIQIFIEENRLNIFIYYISVPTAASQSSVGRKPATEQH